MTVENLFLLDIIQPVIPWRSLRSPKRIHFSAVWVELSPLILGDMDYRHHNQTLEGDQTLGLLFRARFQKGVIPCTTSVGQQFLRYTAVDTRLGPVAFGEICIQQHGNALTQPESC